MIAVDVMGGDHAPDVVIQGALRAARTIPVTLCGPKALLEQKLTHADPAWPTYAVTLVHTNQIVEMDEEPVMAVRRKHDSSLIKTVDLVKQGVATAAISAGNSGAFMAAAALLLGKQDAVERPAIAGYLPTLTGNVLALDLGANTECRPQHLMQFAQMGDVQMRMQGILNPRIALLANGHEDRKGSAVVKEAFSLLKASTLNFVGNVEPDDILHGKADVVVCDGFSGNVMLKTMESVAALCLKLVAAQLEKEDAVVREKGYAALQRVQERLHTRQGGAMLLGVKGTIVVCHGNSDADAIEQAIVFAHKVSNRKFEKIG